MRTYFILPLTVAIAACGSSDDEGASISSVDGDGNVGSYSVRGDDQNGETVIKTKEGVVRIAMGEEAAQNLPMDIKLYPGAEILSSMVGMGEGKSGAMVVFRTDDSADDVMTFYRNELESKEISYKKEIRSGDMQMIGGEQANGGSFNISVTKSPDGSVTATIVAGGPD